MTSTAIPLSSPSQTRDPLPPNLIQKILPFCTTSTLLSLRRTSKSLLDATDPVLYQDIKVDCHVGTTEEADRLFGRLLRLYEVLMYSDGDGTSGSESDGALASVGSEIGTAGVGVRWLKVGKVNKAMCVRGMEFVEITRQEVSDPSTALTKFVTSDIANFDDSAPAASLPTALSDSLTRRELAGLEQITSKQTPPSPPTLTAIQSLLTSILHILPNLRSLRLTGIRVYPTSRDHHLAPVQLLPYIHCPLLQAFSLDAFQGDESVYQFLRRHENLEDVAITINEGGGSDPLVKQDLSRALRKLEKMEAPWQIFDSLFAEAPGGESHVLQPPPLKDATLDFDCVMFYLWGKEEQLLEKLNVFSGTLRKLILKRERFDIDMKVAVTTGKFLPWIEELELRHTYYNGRLSVTEKGIETFAHAFTGFKSLRSLAVLWVGRCWDGSGTVDDRNPEVDRMTVVILGQVCPTLVRCSIYGTSWMRDVDINDGEWACGV